MAFRDQFIKKMRYEILESCQCELLSSYQKIVKKVQGTMPDYFKLPHPKEFILELRGIWLLNNLSQCLQLGDLKDPVMSYWAETMMEFMKYACCKQRNKNNNKCIELLQAAWDAFLVEVALLHLAPLDKPQEIDSSRTKEAFKSLRKNQRLIRSVDWVAPSYHDQDSEVWRWAYGNRRQEHRELTINKLRELLQSYRDTFGWQQTRRLLYHLTKEKRAKDLAPDRRPLPPLPILSRREVAQIVKETGKVSDNGPEIDPARGTEKPKIGLRTTPSPCESRRKRQPDPRHRLYSAPGGSTRKNRKDTASSDILIPSNSMLRNQDSLHPKTSRSAQKRKRLKGPPAELGDSSDMPIDLCGSSTQQAPDIDSSHTEENNPPSQENVFKNTSPVKVSKVRRSRRIKRRASDLSTFDLSESSDDLCLSAEMKPAKRRKRTSSFRRLGSKRSPFLASATERRLRSNIKSGSASKKNVKVKKEWRKWTINERDALWEGLMVFHPTGNTRGVRGCWSHIKDDPRWRKELEHRSTVQMKDKARGWIKSGKLQREIDRRKKEGLLEQGPN